MTKRSLKLTGQGQKQAEQARINLGVTKTHLAERLQIGRATLQKFFAGKPVSYESFQTICTVLKLDWQTIADFDEGVACDLAIGCEESQQTFRVAVESERFDCYQPQAQEILAFDLLGRSEDCQKLEKLTASNRIVLLKAEAGAGKSTLAIHFLKTHFSKVIRLEMGLEFGNVTPATEKISQILRKDFDEEPSQDFQTNLEILKEKLSDRRNPIGILMDNLEPSLDENFRFRENLRSYEDLLRVLCDFNVCSFTLITSRRSLIAQRVILQEYDLKGLSLKAWRQYFHDCKNAKQSEALKKMWAAYNGNAKVMEILHGAIVNRFKGTIEAYWNLYKDALLANPELDNLISVEMDWLERNQSDAYKLLCRMGCYRYQDIKTVPLKGLLCLLWDIPEHHRLNLVEYLCKVSLIEVKDEYFLHPAVREAAKNKLAKNKIEFEEANRNAATFWSDSVKSIEVTEDAIKAFESYYHLVAINDYEEAANIICKEIEHEKIRDFVGKSKTTLGGSFHRFGLLSQMVAAIEKVIKENIKPGYALSKLYSILGDIYLTLGKIQKSIECHEKSKSISIEENIKELELVALNNIGMCKISAWEIADAFLYFNAVKSTCLIDNPMCKRHVLLACSYLAFLHSEKIIFQGDNEVNYEKLYKEALNLELGIRATAYNFLFLGKAFSNLKEFTKARSLYVKLLVFSIKCDFTFMRAMALCSMAELNRGKKMFRAALKKCQQAENLINQIKSDCNAAEIYFQSGLTYQAMGEATKAEEYKKRAIALFKEMEAPKQIERVNKAFAQGG